MIPILEYARARAPLEVHSDHPWLSVCSRVWDAVAAPSAIRSEIAPQLPPRFGCLLVAWCDTHIRGWHVDMACKASALDEADELDGPVRGKVLATHILRDKLLIAITASFRRGYRVHGRFAAGVVES